MWFTQNGPYSIDDKRAKLFQYNLMELRQFQFVESALVRPVITRYHRSIIIPLPSIADMIVYCG